MRYKNKKLKTLGPQAAHLVTTLYEQNKPIFRLKEVEKILRLSELSSRNFVRKLVNRGVVTRLKPGLFILVPFELGKEVEYIGDPSIMAREIMDGKDYFLSHATAMEIHGMVKVVEAMGTEPGLYYHEKIIQAIENKDRKEARQLMKKHLENNENYL
jgi:predicted transcriptional regulator of viral defense system